MTSLLKSFGKGCLYIFVFPVLLVILSVYVVLGLGMFIFMGIKALILFFTGRNFGELPEDIKARAILEGKSEEEETPTIDTTPIEKASNDFVSSYYVPLNQDIPQPKEEDTNTESPKEGEEL